MERRDSGGEESKKIIVAAVSLEMLVVVALMDVLDVNKSKRGVKNGVLYLSGTITSTALWKNSARRDMSEGTH